MQLSGSMVAIVTPFKDGAIDRDAYKKLIEFQIDNGTSGIVPCGTTGESATLSFKEHEELIKLTVELVAGRVPVIAGTGSNNTAEALELTAEAKAAGADAALLITPYYNKPPQEGLYNHYRRIAEEVDLPIVLYNCPGRTSGSLTPETVARLATLKNIVAVKDATSSMDWTSQVCAVEGLTVLSGDDSAMVPMSSLGATGVISVLANIAPRAMADLVESVTAGDYEGARMIHQRFFKLMKLLFCETNPIPIKTACGLMGLCSEKLREPLCPMSAAGKAKLKTEMEKLGMI